MRFKTLIIILTSSMVGVVAGAVTVVCLFNGCTTTFPMSATPLTAQMEGQLAVEMGSDARKGLVMRRGSQEIIVAPPQKVIWTKMLVARSSNCAYVLGYEEFGNKMYHSPSLFRVTFPSPSDPLSSYQVVHILTEVALTNSVGDALILKMDKVSDDGKRLMLTLGFRDPVNAPWATYSRQSAYFFCPECSETNRLNEIIP